MNRKPWLCTLAALLAALAPALAQAEAAQFLFALNRVEVERGSQRIPAQRGTHVEVGDVVHTGPTGYAQLRFKDGALMALKPLASLKVEDFAVPVERAPTTPAQAQAVKTVAASSSPGRSVLRLLRGAFRTITGAIGKGKDDDYRVLTQTATIGIRGTDFSVSASEDGFLFIGVSSGEVVVSNPAGQLVLYDNQYGLVRDRNSRPRQTLAPPDSLETPIPGGGPGSGDTDDTPADRRRSFEGPPARDDGLAQKAVQQHQEDPKETQELQPAKSGLFAFSTSPFQANPTFVGVGRNGVYTNTVGNVIGLRAGNGQGSVATYTIGTARNTNLGSDSASGIRWGRWSGGTARVGDQALDLSQQSLHWIYAASSSAPILPTSGSASYDVVGNTDPTDNFGNIGVLGSATFTANFSSGAADINSTINLGINDQVWQASGSGSLVSDTPVFTGTYSVNVNDALGSPLATGTGDFSGFFTNNAAAAGLSYSLEANLTGGATSVSGVITFTRNDLAGR